MLLLPLKIPPLIFLFHFCYYCSPLIPGVAAPGAGISSLYLFWSLLCCWCSFRHRHPAHWYPVSHPRSSRNSSVFICSSHHSPFWVLPFGVSCSGCLRLMFNPLFLLQEGFKKSPQCQWEALPVRRGFGGCWCFSGVRSFLCWGHVSHAGGTRAQKTSALISGGAAHPEIRRFKVQ